VLRTALETSCPNPNGALRNSAFGLRQVLAVSSFEYRHHHNPQLMQHYNFNISNPIGDWLFGTRYRSD